MRKEYKMTQAQLDKLMDACKPVRYMVMGGRAPMSPLENANRAWKALGKEMGFDGMSAAAVPGKGDKYFTAEEVKNVTDRN